MRRGDPVIAQSLPAGRMAVNRSARFQSPVPSASADPATVWKRGSHMGEIEKRWHPATAAAHALGWEDEVTKSLIPPIHLTSTYIRDPDNQYRSGRSYGRPHNPTHEVPERLLSHLEGGAGAMLFSSRM